MVESVKVKPNEARELPDLTDPEVVDTHRRRAQELARREEMRRRLRRLRASMTLQSGNS